MENNTAPDFDEAFEKDHGPALTRELLSLPKPGARELIAHAAPAHALRESYPEYWDGKAPATRAEANAVVEAAFPFLTPSRRGHLATLIRFAVHTEMKHWDNPEFVLSPDHDYELLVSASDYVDETEFTEDGQDRNQSLWEELADTAAFHAAAENAAAARSVRMAA
ncbi:hypothetical protein [Arthrobacter sp. zg-Y1110]|uniref:hypothetical protein n=1 Tax=Arthrobacter sp. zg-Y1110 TaxID=2886932 RepID=UPI001D137932|nr:hypothetical protein [Arthrobacter sp. zg-Y1110]MCC3292991.1 hypothetical protein [Arthrobacter sp. zg-Y1110]UWX86930.1 hypothetical protein N2K99_18980 [Arthrobacter sp. zg-Y1110]